MKTLLFSTAIAFFSIGHAKFFCKTKIENAAAYEFAQEWNQPVQKFEILDFEQGPWTETSSPDFQTSTSTVTVAHSTHLHARTYRVKANRGIGFGFSICDIVENKATSFTMDLISMSQCRGITNASQLFAIQGGHYNDIDKKLEDPILKYVRCIEFGGTSTSYEQKNIDEQGRIFVQIRANITSDLLSTIELVGGEVTSNHANDDFIYVWIPADELWTLALRSEVFAVGTVIDPHPLVFRC